MFDLVQPNCFEALHASIAEAAHRLQPRHRAEYVEACLRREIRGSNALKQKAFQAMTDSRHRIIWVLETLGVENAWRAGHQIASAADTLTVSQLEHLMLNFDYGTAHQSIEAIAHLEKLQIAIQRYVDAKNDAWRARDLCRRLRNFQVGLEDYMAISEEISQLKRLGVLAILRARRVAMEPVKSTSTAPQATERFRATMLLEPLPVIAPATSRHSRPSSFPDHRSACG